MSREAMKQALEALESDPLSHAGLVNRKQAIAALRQALEEKQEPVAFINVEKQKLEWAKLTSWHTPTIVNLPKIPLYTSPPKREWVGLTDDELTQLYCDVDGKEWCLGGLQRQMQSEKAVAAGDAVLMNEQASLLRECRAALDSLIAQKPTLAGLLCGSTTLGNLKAELHAYRPQGVFGSAQSIKEKNT
jgi:hypothetical protein